MTIRGISNTTGTACHLSSALLILCHSVMPIRLALVKYAETSAANAWYQQLGAFLSRLANEGDDSNSDDDCDDVIDPKSFYKALRKEIGIEANELGDAATALVKLLQNVRQGVPEMQPIFQATIDNGRVHSVIQGKLIQPDGTILQRKKELKSRPMACPFSLSGESECIEAALQAALEPQSLQGYNWSGTYAEQLVSEPSTTGTSPLAKDEWQNAKSLHLESIPNFWILHLQRFETHQGIQTASRNHIRVQKYFELPEFGATLSLMGGIAHVSENAEQDEEDGHYVAIVRHGDNEWSLVDDGNVSRVQEETALQLLGGAPDTITSRGSYMQGVLLVYKRPESDEAIQTTLASFFKELAKSYIDWSEPEVLVGRRLRVKWSKGKFYTGIVASYNPETGKHQVRYKDGDVRDYRLRQKTIEWLELDAGAS